jgi:hypothetical protein
MLHLVYFVVALLRAALISPDRDASQVCAN